MYKKGQLALAGALAAIALIIGLVFAFPRIIPDSAKNAIENYELAKVDKQVKTEKLANWRGYPILSVIGKSTIVDSYNCNITSILENIGGSKCIDPTVKHIIAKDAEPGVTEGHQIGSPIYGGVYRTQLYPGSSQSFNIDFSSTNTPLCDLLDNNTAYGQPHHQLELEITTQCYATTGHQFQETETVIVTPNQPPVADAGPDQNVNVTATAGVVNFDGSGSYDPDGSISSYSWDFGDGNTGTGVTPANTYAISATTYTVTLVVTDNTGLTDADTMTLTTVT